MNVVINKIWDMNMCKIPAYDNYICPIALEIGIKLVVVDPVS